MEGGLPDYFRCFSQELLATRISRMLKNNTYLDALPLLFWKAGVQFTTFEKCKVRIKFSLQRHLVIQGVIPIQMITHDEESGAWLASEADKFYGFGVLD